MRLPAWLFRLAHQWSSAPRNTRRRLARRPARPRLEVLEDRLTPSADLLAIFPVGQGVAPNQPTGAITLELQDSQGHQITAASDVSVQLSSNSNTGTFLDLTGKPLANSSLVIPAGSSFGLFEYEDSQSGYAGISASANGFSYTESYEVSVRPALAFTTSAQELQPGQASQPITVQLQDGNGNPITASSDVTVNLSISSFPKTGKFLDTSGNPLSNSSIVIHAGSNSASFEYEDTQNGYPILQAQESDTGEIVSQQESVGYPLPVPTASPPLVFLVSPPQAIALNQPSQPMTVQLQDNQGHPIAATNPVTVTLSSSSSGGQFLDTSGNLLANSSVVIPAGSSVASFEYQDNQAGLPTITAAGQSDSSLQQEDVGGVSLVYTTAPQTFATGQDSSPITVQLQDSNGNAVKATSAITVYLSSYPSGTFLDTSGNPLSGYSPSVTIAAGTSSASFGYKSAYGGSPTLTASVGGGALNVAGLTATQKETINGLSSLVFTTPPPTLPVGLTPQTSSLMTLQLEDNNGNPDPAPNGGLTVNLSAGLGSGSATGLVFLDANGNPLTNSSLAIPEGSSTVSFKFQYQTTTIGFPLYIQADVPNTPLFASQSVSIQPGPFHGLRFSSGQPLQVGTPSGAMQVILTDQFGNETQAGSGGVAVQLSSTSSGGQFLTAAGDPLASNTLTIPQGVSRGTFEYVDSQAGTPMLTATANEFSANLKPTVNPLSSEIHVTTTADSGDGSLRAAITTANANPGSTIVFDAGVTGTIDLLAALPAITASTNILGPGANVLTVERSSSATGTFAGFVIQPASFFSIPTVTISGLTVANFNAAGIHESGNSLTLKQVVVRNNSFDIHNTPALGGVAGGIIAGDLTVVDSTIADNTAQTSGDGAGGIDSDGGFTTIINSTISGNVESDNGPAGEGGIGGVRLANNAYVANSTISGNSGSAAGGLQAYGGVTLYDTIVAGNTVSVNSPPDVFGKFLSQGYNLIGIANSSSSGFINTDLVGTSTNPIAPKLGALADNGGPTPTMALLAGSPAIAAGSSVNAPATDQRGDARPQQGAIDIGAFEATTSSTAPISLRPGSPLATATAGVFYSQTITASGGTGDKTVTGNFTSDADGLSFSQGTNSLTISGTPKTAETVTFTVSATDAANDSFLQSYSLTFVAATNPAAPVVTDITPNNGPVGGGTNVTITGTGFTGATAVSFGGTQLTGSAFTVVDDDHITLSTPAGSAAGRIDVSVTTANGTSAASNAARFTYTNANVPIRLSPDSPLTPTTAGVFYSQTLTASGGTGDKTVTGNFTSDADGLSFSQSTNSLTISGTPTTAETVTFDVTATDTANVTTGQSYTLIVNAATLPAAPTVTDITPNNGPVGGGTNVTITGSGFIGATAVTFGGTRLTGSAFTVVDDNHITLSTPAVNSAGRIDVSVTTASGTSAASNAARFTYTNASVPIRLSPDSPLTPATAGTSYSQTITASGGAQSVTGQFTSNADGLTFTPGTNTLTISGSPVVAGIVTFDVIATDAAGGKTTVSYSLLVNSAAPTAAPAPAPTPSQTISPVQVQQGVQDMLSITQSFLSGNVSLLFSALGDYQSFSPAAQQAVLQNLNDLLTPFEMIGAVPDNPLVDTLFVIDGLLSGNLLFLARGVVGLSSAGSGT